MRLRTMFVTSLLPVCSAALIVTGCDRDRNMGAPAREPVGRSTGQKMDDKEVAGRVKSALDDNAAYKFPDVKVTVFKGTAQLSGFVNKGAQKDRATELAKNAAGVKEVVNNITVKPQGDMPTPTGRSTTGERISTDTTTTTTTITTTNAAPRSTDRSTNPNQNPSTNP